MKKTIVATLSLIALTTATSAMAAQSVYRCNGVDASAGEVTFTVGNAYFVKVDESAADLDPSYEPTLNSGYTRFMYEQNIEGTGEVLVQERLLKGARTGFIKVQSRGEGFISDKFACTKQD